MKISLADEGGGDEGDNALWVLHLASRARFGDLSTRGGERGGDIGFLGGGDDAHGFFYIERNEIGRTCVNSVMWQALKERKNTTYSCGNYTLHEFTPFVSILQRMVSNRRRERSQVYQKKAHIKEPEIVETIRHLQIYIF